MNLLLLFLSLFPSFFVHLVFVSVPVAAAAVAVAAIVVTLNNAG
jgi:hypothetical protein